MCKEIGIKQIFTSVEHPQTNEQVEAVNKIILQGLKKKVEHAKARWVELLPEIVWSYHTTVQSTMREILFSLVNGTNAVIPVELSVPSRRVEDFREPESQVGRLLHLDMVDELRETIRIREVAAKRMIETKFLSRVNHKGFRKGDLVLRKARENKKDSKLAARWTEPYRVREVLGKGAYCLETLDGGIIPRT